jgi:hypothetical protein
MPQRLCIIACMKQDHIQSFGDTAQASSTNGKPLAPPGPATRWGGTSWLRDMARDFTGHL